MQTPRDQGFERYHIERFGRGYRVVGNGVMVWEETLQEASYWLRELESPSDRRASTLHPHTQDADLD